LLPGATLAPGRKGTSAGAGAAEIEHQRMLLPQHRPPRGQGMARTQPHPEEKAILVKPVTRKTR
jgi:hypothetical protein